MKDGKVRDLLRALEASEREVARLGRIVASVDAVLADVRDDLVDLATEPFEPCSWANEHDCHATARYFLEHLVHCALEGNDTALRVREART